LRKNIREIVIALLIALTFFAPFLIEARQLLGGSRIRLIAPFWSLVSYSSAPFVLEFDLITLLGYLIPWAINILFILLAYYALGRDTLTRGKYAGLTIVLIIAQAGYSIYMMLTNVGPLFLMFPVPLVGIVSFMATPFIDRVTP
jgi:hypothetical protein